VCCSVLQCAAMCCCVLLCSAAWVAACCSVLQCLTEMRAFSSSRRRLSSPERGGKCAESKRICTGFTARGQRRGERQSPLNDGQEHTATHCNTLQHTATTHSKTLPNDGQDTSKTLSCNVLQCAAVCCSVLQHRSPPNDGQDTSANDHLVQTCLY